MKSLVVFYSRTGNTKKVAKAISAELQADLEPIIDQRNREGLLGYLSAAWDMIFNREAKIAPVVRRPEDYDMVVVGTPIWNWLASSPVQAYLRGPGTRMKKVAYFCVGESGEPQVFVQMRDLSGKEALEARLFSDVEVESGDYTREAMSFVAKIKSHFGEA